MKVSATIMVFCLASCLTSTAQMPQQFYYDAYYETNGSPYIGRLSVTIRLYTNYNLGSFVYSCTNQVQTDNGYFSVLIGQHTVYGNLSNTLASGNTWIETFVDQQSAAISYEQLSPVAYALTANEVRKGSITADMLAHGSVTSDKIGVGAVTSEQLAEGAVTESKISSDILTGRYVRVSGDTMTGILTINVGSQSNLVLRSSGSGIAIGDGARGELSGIAMGRYADGSSEGLAIGLAARGVRGLALGSYTVGENGGVAVGTSASAANEGVAVGSSAKGSDWGVGVGAGAQGQFGGASLGYSAVGVYGGVSIGNYAEGSYWGIGIGTEAEGQNGGIALGTLANGQGWGNIALGLNSSTENGWQRIAIGRSIVNKIDNSIAVRGSLYLDGGTGIYYRTSVGSGNWMPLALHSANYYTKTEADTKFVTGMPIYVESDPEWTASKTQYITAVEAAGSFVRRTGDIASGMFEVDGSVGINTNAQSDRALYVVGDVEIKGALMSAYIPPRGGLSMGVFTNGATP